MSGRTQDAGAIRRVAPFTPRREDHAWWPRLLAEACEALHGIGLSHYSVNALAPSKPGEATRILDEAACACQEAMGVLRKFGHHGTLHKVEEVHARVVRALLAASEADRIAGRRARRR